jgi:DNA-binding response OmpR family regulator
LNLKQILKNLNVLYAEDDEAIRTNTTKTLEIFFKNVFTASDGVEALEIYNNETVHILFLDYVMPCIDGYALAKEIRQSNPNIPIIICSGFSDKEKLHNAIELGVVRYIEKPLKYDELISSFESCIDTLKRENLLKIKITSTLVYDYINKVIEKNDETITLSKKEIKLLELFIKEKSKLVSKEMIIDEVFENEDVEPNTVRNLVYRLRKIIDNDKVIASVKDFGYMLAV